MSAASPPITGSNADPEFRRIRAKHAARVRNSLDNHIAKLVAAAPELTPEQRDRVASLLRTNGEAAQT